MTNEKGLQGAEFSRRTLLKGAALAAASLALAGDALPDDESPVGKYDKYTAAGDSYTQGYGAPFLENGLPNGYPPRLAADIGAECNNIAKIGWTPEEFLHGRGNIPSQLELLPANANLVTFTLRGNAVNLRSFGGVCLTSTGCGRDTITDRDAMRVLTSAKHLEDLQESCEGILEKAPNADIMGLGYLNAIVPTGFPEALKRLLRGSGVPDLTVLGYANDEAISDIVRTCNANLKETIERIANPRLVYVEPQKGADIISTRMWHRPDYFHLANSEYAGHPNGAGYELVKNTARVALTALYNRNKIKTGLKLHGMGMGK